MLFGKIIKTEQKMMKLSTMLNHLYVKNKDDEKKISIIMPNVNHHDLHTQRSIFRKF